MNTTDASVAATGTVGQENWMYRWGQWVSDWVNPIIVKELRQAVRSWVAQIMLLLYLAVQLLIVGLVLTRSTDDLQSDAPVGAEVFFAVQLELLVTTIFFLPLYAAIRLFLERSDVNLDLMFITPLRPLWLVLGKLLAALVLGLLFFSASAPVMTMAFFLRGLDLRSAAVVLGLDVIAMIVAVQTALFVAAVPGSRPVMAIFGVGFPIGLLFAVGYLSELSYDLLHLASLESFAGAGITALTYLAGYLILFTATHGLLSPPLSNRMVSFKVTFLIVSPAYLLLVWLVASLNLGASIPFLDLDQFALISIPRIVLIMSWIAWTIAISERLQWGSRVAAQIPRSGLLRVVVFPFYSGAANGMAYALLYMLLVVPFWLLRLFDVASRSHSPITSYGMPITFYGNPNDLWGLFVPELLAEGYVIAYALTAFHVRRYLEFRFGRSLPGWVLMMLTVALVGFATSLVVLIGGLLRMPNEALPAVCALTPWPLIEMAVSYRYFGNELEAYHIYGCVVVPVWLVAVGIPTFLWWLRAVRNFRPPAETAAAHTVHADSSDAPSPSPTAVTSEQSA